MEMKDPSVEARLTFELTFAPKVKPKGKTPRENSDRMVPGFRKHQSSAEVVISTLNER